jgi:hypothetical protein
MLFKPRHDSTPTAEGSTGRGRGSHQETTRLAVPHLDQLNEELLIVVVTCHTARRADDFPHPERRVNRSDHPNLEFIADSARLVGVCDVVPAERAHRLATCRLPHVGGEAVGRVGGLCHTTIEPQACQSCQVRISSGSRLQACNLHRLPPACPQLIHRGCPQGHRGLANNPGWRRTTKRTTNRGYRTGIIADYLVLIINTPTSWAYSGKPFCKFVHYSVTTLAMNNITVRAHLPFSYIWNNPSYKLPTALAIFTLKYLHW